jgi:gliding motility-associated-like protein
MTGIIWCKGKRLFISLLILFGCSGASFAFQTPVNDVINKYGRVTGVGTDYVIVNDLVQFSKFSIGDTVLVIQMKGVQTLVPETNAFGNPQFLLGRPGKYEFLIILSIDGGLKKIVFRSNLINSYNVAGDVQIVKTPSYSSVIVTADLTSAPWDSVNKIGGVLAMIVRKTIKLNANIDVTGKGFLGGGIVTGLGLCVNSSFSRFDKFAFHADSVNSGFKGESPVSSAWTNGYPIFPSYSKGKGANFTGGGGGNGAFSGGGGGANYGLGGKGGSERDNCFPLYNPVFGGLGGKSLIGTPLDSSIFLGAGGGSSTYYTGATPSPGGNGGGIVIILCDSIIGNGKFIKADGGSVAGASGNAGAGGGGGGGSVALYLVGFSSSNVTISANGGKGGNNLGQYFGEGGGGGGGLIWINNVNILPNVTQSVTGGAVGTRPGSSFGGNGTLGQSRDNFKAVLNGFLFNAIHSTGSGDQIDSICSNMVPRPLTGTSPVGGVTPYTFLWQSSTASETSGFGPATGTNNLPGYSPAILSQTTWFRRVVTDNGTPALSDTSKTVKIIVQPFIKFNDIGNQDTICYNKDPLLLHQLIPDVTDGNNKSYYFKWQDSTSAASWGPTLASTKNFAPAGLKKTTWFRRTVTSGTCIDSAAKVRITVFNSLRNNQILNAPPDICFGMTFVNLSGSSGATTPKLSGGDSINTIPYRYLWQSNINSSGWGPASALNNSIDYNPVELAQRLPFNEYYFRRVVYSGIHDACIDTSLIILLKDYPVLTNNTITLSQTLCSGSAPGKLIGSVPQNGNGVYTFIWQDSTKIQTTWTNIPGATGSDFQPPALADTTRYRRIVFSSACSDISKSVIINVHKPIISNNIFLLSAVKWDTTICFGATPRTLKGSIPTGGSNAIDSYQWESSANKTSGYTSLAGATGKDFSPAALTVTTYYRRKIFSGTCSAISDSVITIKVLPLITANTISSAQTVCYNTIPALLAGTVPANGAGAGTYLYLWRESPDGIIWADASGSNTGRDYQPPSLSLPRRYRRIVKSGNFNCCIDSSNIISIGINQLPTGKITVAADTMCESPTLTKPLVLNFKGASPWRVYFLETKDGTPVAPPFTQNNVISNNPTFDINRSATGDYSTYVFKFDSLRDANNCKALPDSLTGTRKVVVYKNPNSVAGSDATICGPDYTLKAVPSFGPGTAKNWTWSKISTATGPGNVVFNPNVNDHSAKVSVDSLSAAWELENRYKFVWKEANWKCADKDSVQITFYKRTASIAPVPAKDLYSLDKIDTLKADIPLVGTGVWSIISGGSTLDPATNIVSGLALGENKFSWKVTNGDCYSAIDYVINVYELKIPEGFSPNNDMINDEFVIEGLDLTYNDVSLRILNSAGTEVYYSSNTGGNNFSSFKGENSNGTLPEGTYYYLLTIKSKRSSAALSRSGFIILKRYNYQ